MKPQIFWYNGNLIYGDTLELSIADPGLLYGATVFTTLRVYHRSLDSHLTNWVAHCDRLLSTIQKFSWQQPNWERLRRGAEALVPHFPVLRSAIFPDGRELITGRFLPDDLTERQQYGISAWVASDNQFRRSIPECKTGNYLSAWLALNKARSFGAVEAILVDSDGNWLETSTGNLWGWRDGHWWTPPLEAGILPGVARSQLIAWLSSHARQVGFSPWTADLVRGFEAIAHTNCVVEVVPIRAVANQTETLTYDPDRSELEQLRSLFHYHTDKPI